MAVRKADVVLVGGGVTASYTQLTLPTNSEVLSLAVAVSFATNISYTAVGHHKLSA